MQQSNLAYIEDPREELIGGTLVAMSPSPTVNHTRIVRNLCIIFGNYLEGKRCEVFQDSVDLFLSEDDRFIPDLMIVCDPTKIKSNGVYGAPDLVVEVLSESTWYRDRTAKRDAYARAGVMEYWIVDPIDQSIEQYFLENGSYTLQAIYGTDLESKLNHLVDSEKAKMVSHFQCHLFNDLDIGVQEIFSGTHL